MTAREALALSPAQVELLGQAFRSGAVRASDALSRWIGKPVSIRLEALQQLPLEQATGILGDGDEPICFCAAELEGYLTGELVLSFDDASGLALADLILDQPEGTAVAWGDMETSAALETVNILGCAYLGALIEALPRHDRETSELLPSPPRFNRDFAESMLEFMMMDQGVSSDQVLLAQVQFQIDARPIDWRLLLVPAAASMSRLRKLAK